MPKYLSGTYTSTYTLTTNPTTVTSTGLIDVGSANASGIIAFGPNTWTVTNLGTVVSTGTVGNGINIQAAGLVTNGASGSAQGYIYATGSGIQIGPGEVINYGTVKARPTASSN